MITTEDLEPGIVVQPDFAFIDTTNAEQFSVELRNAVKQHDKIMLDLSAVEFLDSTGLGKILELVRTVRTRKGKIVICNVQSEVGALFRMVRLSSMVTIVEDRERAREALV